MDSIGPDKIMAVILVAGSVFATVGAGPGPAPVASLLAHADTRRGARDAARQCGTCHSFEPGGAAIVGPNLHDVLGAPIAAARGYDFSPALHAKGGAWTFDALNRWLENPRGFAPGTRMMFAGISNDRQRADIIDYLRTLSANPPPLPPPPLPPQ